MRIIFIFIMLIFLIFLPAVMAWLIRRKPPKDVNSFPDPLKTKEESISSMSEIRVRFAPSPTGYLHVGG
ncbi:MAG: hypothetical protein J2P21_05330, partial [Chloracidobacterium sp.]|nr:hypothetical protein [Chloracidobacterium sp.]